MKPSNNDVPFFLPFNKRNELINDDGRDINEIPFNQQYSILTSYVREKDIYDGVCTRNTKILTGRIKGKNLVPYDNYTKGINLNYAWNRIINSHKYSELSSVIGLINPFIFGIAVVDLNLKAYWKWNESSADIINQSQSAVDLGPAADIQITGATYSQSGKIGNSLLFDGIDDYGVVGTSLSQFSFARSTTALVTIAFWLKLLADAPAGNEDIIMADTGATGGTGFSVAVGNGKVFQWNTRNSSGQSIINGNSAADYFPDLTNWYFYLLTYDQSLTDTNLTVKRNDANSFTANKGGNTPSNIDSEAALQFARRADNLKFLNANTDEASIWNKIMSSADQTSLYNGGSGREIY